MTATMPAETVNRTNEIRRMQTRFERWLPVLISSRGSRVVKQLERSKPMGLVKQFIADFYEQILEAKGKKSLARFLEGEFTGDAPPISIVKMVKGDVMDIVETATIIEVMQEKFDVGEWNPSFTVAEAFNQSVVEAAEGSVQAELGEVLPPKDPPVEFAPHSAGQNDISALPPPMPRRHAKNRR